MCLVNFEIFLIFKFFVKYNILFFWWGFGSSGNTSPSSLVPFALALSCHSLDPNEHKYFDYMLSYSPYDNVRAQPYPNILITAGLHDPRVAYWEPAKWSSKIRNLKTNGNEVLAKYDLDSGHFSASDRYKYLREKAWEQAYVLAKVGLAGAVKRPSTQ